MENNEVQKAEQGKSKVKYRIGTLAVVILLVAATIADLITLIPIAGDIVGPIYWVLVAIYLWKAGFGFVNARMLASEAIGLIGEIIPAVQEFPFILGGTIAIIIISRTEDKTGISMLKTPGIRKPNVKPPPLNAKPGIRPPRNQQAI